MTNDNTDLAAGLDENREAQRILSVPQVAMWLKLSREEVVRLAEEGDLPGRKIGGEWRFGILAMNRWVAGTAPEVGMNALEQRIEALSAQVAELSERIQPVLEALPDLPVGRVSAAGEVLSFDADVTLTLESLEMAYIHHVLRRCQQNKTQAATALGIDPSTLYRKLSRE